LPSTSAKNCGMSQTQTLLFKHLDGAWHRDII